MLEQYTTEAASLLIGIGAGIFIRAKLWWGQKPLAEKKAAIDDAIASMEDGRITTAEVRALVKKYL